MISYKDYLRHVTMHVESEPGNDVYIAGSFNSWNQNTMKLSDPHGDGHFYTTLLLPRGNYEYKFVINGVWQTGDESDQSVQNNFGSYNNFLEVE